METKKKDTNRNLKILLELVLKHIRPAFEDPKEEADGICFMPDYLWYHDHVNLGEFELLDEFVSNEFKYDSYRWIMGEIIPKERWLTEQIQQL